MVVVTTHKQEEKCVVALQELIKVPMDIEVIMINKALVASMEVRNQNKAISMIFHHSMTYK